MDHYSHDIAHGRPEESDTQTKPKLFTLSTSQTLESRRLNTPQMDQQAGMLSSRMTSDQPQRRILAQTAPRLLLNTLLPNPGRTTPVVARTKLANQNIRADEQENRSSSPQFSAFESPNHAYIPSNGPPSASPSDQHTFRLSALQRPSKTSRLSLNSEMPHPMTGSQHTRKDANFKTHDHFIHYLNTTSFENQQLTSDNERLSTLNAHQERELKDCRARLANTAAQLESAGAELKSTRPNLVSTRENLAAREGELAVVKEALVDTKMMLGTANTELASVRETSTQERLENERLRTTIETAKNSIAKLFIELGTLGENRRELKKAYDNLNTRYSQLFKEAEETKFLARNGLTAIEPMLDDEGTLSRALETKTVLKELQHDLSASQEVTDILRNKLHHQGSQLVEAQSRIRELEDEKRGALQVLVVARKEEKKQMENVAVIEGQLATLSERLSVREKEMFDALACAATKEAELKAAISEIEVYKQSCQSQSKELDTLRVIKEDNISRLLVSQDVINARDKEAVALNGEVKALSESKAELRALLSEVKHNLAEKEVELRAKDPNEELQVEIRDLSARCESLKAALDESQERHVLYEHAAKALQVEMEKKMRNVEKANNELSSKNNLLQESLAKVQDELRSASVTIGKLSNLQSELEKSMRNFEGLAAENAELKTSLTTEKSELKTRLEVQSVSLFQAKEDCASLKEQNSELKTRLEVQSSNFKQCLGELSELKSRLEATDINLSKSKESCALLKQRLDELSELKSRLEVQSNLLSRSNEECALLKERASSAREQQTALQTAMAKLQRDSDHLVKSHEKRALGAEKIVALTENKLTETTQSLQGMEVRLANVTQELETMRTTAASVENLSTLKSSEKSARLEQYIAKLEHDVAELSRKNAEVGKRADEIVKRYKQGQLTDTEKEFVRHLMGEAKSIHEEGVVKKDNELRRREHMIQALNEKVAEQQTIVARLLREKNGQLVGANKSIVDPKAWLTSSPENPTQESADMGAKGEDSKREGSMLDVAPSRAAEPASASRSIAETRATAGPDTFRFCDMDNQSDVSALSSPPEDEASDEHIVGNKRGRSPSPYCNDGQPSHAIAKRRTRTSATGQIPSSSGIQRIKISAIQNKAAEGGSKSKSKKRK